MVLRRVGIFSAGKVSGTLAGLMGLLFGAMLALVSLAGVAMQPPAGPPNAPQIPAVFFGVGAVIILPLIYGFFGFVSGIIYAALYNLIAGMVGGLEMEFEQAP